MNRTTYADLVRVLHNMSSAGELTQDNIHEVLGSFEVAPMGGLRPSFTYKAWQEMLGAVEVPAHEILDVARGQGWDDPDSIRHLSRLQTPVRDVFLMDTTSDGTQIYAQRRGAEEGPGSGWVTEALPDFVEAE